MSLRSMLTASVSIGTTSTVTRDAYGGFATASTKVSIPASVQVDTSRESMEYERQTKARTFNIYCESTATIAAGVRISVESGPYVGVIIDSVAAKADHAGRGTYWMIRGTEVL